MQLTPLESVGFIIGGMTFVFCRRRLAENNPRDLSESQRPASTRFELSYLIVGVVFCLMRIGSLAACALPEVSRAHDEMLEVRSRLRPGMTPEDVVSMFDEVQPKYLLRPRLSVVVIIAQAVPQGWAAKEWVLWVSLRQGRVAAVRIRTNDSPGERPREAPPDLVWSEEDGPTPFSHP